MDFNKMIPINGDEEELQIMSAKLTFLKTFPLDEIDNPDIQLICKSYKNDNSSLVSCLTYLRKYDSYFYNWYKNNRLCNAFYNRR
jgi:hypothetical protein